jgi:hypothetical protein
MERHKYRQMSLKDLHECKLIGYIEIYKYDYIDYKYKEDEGNAKILAITEINLYDHNGAWIKKSKMKDIKDLLPLYKVVFK